MADSLAAEDGLEAGSICTQSVSQRSVAEVEKRLGRTPGVEAAGSNPDRTC